MDVNKYSKNLNLTEFSKSFFDFYLKNYPQILIGYLIG